MTAISFVGIYKNMQKLSFKGLYTFLFSLLFTKTPECYLENVIYMHQKNMNYCHLQQHERNFREQELC